MMQSGKREGLGGDRRGTVFPLLKDNLLQINSCWCKYSPPTRTDRRNTGFVYSIFNVYMSHYFSQYVFVFDVEAENRPAA